ncbi:MAG: hypothetical protein SISXV1_gp1 [Sanya Ischnura senegalensis xinmovirus 1]|uniref:Uncharacterized protein n=1 Tax=Sanya Ischnura senegalensis xinmovirus 1 TaxID=2905558 RepID=A0A8K1XGV8_9MONO|nr:MAG: hypothetical protein SISXV1_gp1 [Sanya Ischnura senegalensis xinmovirus 1]
MDCELVPQEESPPCSTVNAAGVRVAIPIAIVTGGPGVHIVHYNEEDALSICEVLWDVPEESVLRNKFITKYNYHPARSQTDDLSEDVSDPLILIPQQAASRFLMSLERIDPLNLEQVVACISYSADAHLYDIFFKHSRTRVKYFGRPDARRLVTKNQARLAAAAGLFSIAKSAGSEASLQKRVETLKASMGWDTTIRVAYCEKLNKIFNSCQDSRRKFVEWITTTHENQDQFTSTLKTQLAMVLSWYEMTSLKFINDYIADFNSSALMNPTVSAEARAFVTQYNQFADKNAFKYHKYIQGAGVGLNASDYPNLSYCAIEYYKTYSPSLKDYVHKITPTIARTILDPLIQKTLPKKDTVREFSEEERRFFRDNGVDVERWERDNNPCEVNNQTYLFEAISQLLQSRNVTTQPGPSTSRQPGGSASSSP